MFGLKGQTKVGYRIKILITKILITLTKATQLRDILVSLEKCYTKHMAVYKLAFASIIDWQMSN